jgi:class III lanthionine synthetase
MDRKYEAFCITDTLFYDTPHSGPAAESLFDLAKRDTPAGWRQVTQGEWHICVPPDCELPPQGWKIHVSACRDNADKVLEAVWDYCLPRKISFKFLRGPVALLMRNAKYASRGGSGKLVTIYPLDDAHCERILAELGELLDGEPGPYILSDLRYGSGPLHVRYGGFSQRLCLDASGELVSAIEDPSGRLVPDVRSPVFRPPPWVVLPSFLAPHLAARDAAKAADLPYTFERALHFSNGGGVYAGVDKRTGERVVLKEARPYAGLSADGADAVARLRREHDILRCGGPGR